MNRLFIFCSCQTNWSICEFLGKTFSKQDKRFCKHKALAGQFFFILFYQIFLCYRSGGGQKRAPCPILLGLSHAVFHVVSIFIPAALPQTRELVFIKSTEKPLQGPELSEGNCTPGLVVSKFVAPRHKWNILQSDQNQQFNSEVIAKIRWYSRSLSFHL